MNIQGIDHLELYVADADRAASELCAAYGFRLGGEGDPRTGLAGQRSVLVRLGEIQILLTCGLSADHPASRYVRRHGDGVAVIALSADNVETAFAEAVRRGADPVETPVVYERGFSRVTFGSVSGFGDVTHRFVTRRGPDDDFAPGAIRQPVPPHPRQPLGHMKDSCGGLQAQGRLDGPGAEDAGVLEAIDHIAACVPAGTLGAVARAYRDIFGFTQIFEERIEIGGQAMDSKVVQSPSRAVTLTLLEPVATAEAGQIDEFLQSHGGPGVQHVAFRTPDIVETVRILEKRGVRFLTAPPAYYDTLQRRLGEAELPLQEFRSLGVLADRDPWGLMFQIFTESVHLRRTLFFELIERRGALTFGSGNIRALYEAVALGRASAGPLPAPAPRRRGTPADF
jgi:4-hydroxymandelate synthase